MNDDDPRPPTARRIAIVFNPSKVDVARLREIVRNAESRHGSSGAVWFETGRDDDGAQAAMDAAAAGASCVVVVGGDGTVRVVAEQLAGTKVPLVIAAVGTGNLFARALKLPINDPKTAVESAFTGSARPIDVGHATLQRTDGGVTSNAFLVMAGIGLDARMAAGTNARLKKHVGWLAYAEPIGHSVMENADFAVHYRLDARRRRSTRAHTIIVGNCGTLTGGVLLIPDAQPDDGILDTVILRPGGARGWMQIGVRLLLARFLHRTRTGGFVRRVTRRPYALRFDSARQISVEFNSPQEVELDGDSFGTITGAQITVQPGALQLLV
ncbi:diacylglycerol/lipid kinase family protein [Gryllotalpicola reticulitermitis]|uniref:Diacylglycerol/lipid kinase family protein n=1 Tax=Gryllotalpicola reticulitermitis TaxID=1184153 RepID=A0ABV8Q5H5_9MICO